jgi:hypothetical protein
MMQKWRWLHGSVGILAMTVVSSNYHFQEESFIFAFLGTFPGGTPPL